MKTFRIIVLLLVLGINATAQENQNFAKILDTYVGTWVYQKNDTVFKIKFQKVNSYGQKKPQMDFMEDIIYQSMEEYWKIIWENFLRVGMY